ncbi:MAG: hypothetical protein K2G55_01715 [Lachnospiraceae bacterium]|nr:hypothetical protein [Lachnospiraceae bacterium]MDE7205149.1 hypothetical protein [Lachnospiraceae bacterium]
MTEVKENLEKRFEEFLARDEALEKRIAALEAQINLQNEKEEIEKSSKYPKRIMRLSELIKLGYTREYLMKQYRIKGQRFAKKQNPALRNSPIIFDTELFEQQQQRQQAMENRQIRRG